MGILDYLARPGDYTRGALSGNLGKRVTSREMFGIENKEGWGDDVSSFVLDMLTDPLTYIPFGALFKGGKSLAKIAKMAGPRFKHSNRVLRASRAGNASSWIDPDNFVGATSLRRAAGERVPPMGSPKQSSMDLIPDEAGFSRKWWPSSAKGIRSSKSPKSSLSSPATTPTHSSMETAKAAMLPEEVLEYIPPGSKYIGQGIEATAFKAPNGKVIRIEGPASIDKADKVVGRLKHESILQPYSTHAVKTREGTYIIEALPHAKSSGKQIKARLDDVIKNPTKQEATWTRDKITRRLNKQHEKARDSVYKARQALNIIRGLPESQQAKHLWEMGFEVGDQIRALNRVKVPRRVHEGMLAKDVPKHAMPFVEQRARKAADLVREIDTIKHMDDVDVVARHPGQAITATEESMRDVSRLQGDILKRPLEKDLKLHWSDNHPGNIGRTDDGFWKIIDPGHMYLGREADDVLQIGGRDLISSVYPNKVPDLPFNSVARQPYQFKSKKLPLADLLGYKKWTQDAMFSPRLRSPALKQALLGQGLLFSGPIGTSYAARAGGNQEILQ